MTLVAALAAVATWLLVPRSRARSRLPRPVPTVPAPAVVRGRQIPALPLGVLAGVAVALALPGAPGVALGLGLAVAVPWVMRQLAEREVDGETADDGALPLALDMLAACLAGGAAPLTAVAAVAAATTGPLGARLERVASGMSLGLPPDEAFRALGEEGPAGVAARTLRRSMEGGTPVAKAVARVAEEARHASSVAAQARARRLSVKAVAPLLVCFLPAFLLLGVVPALYGVFAEIFGELG